MGCYDIASNMKTTLDIADALLDEAREVARARSITLKELVERGLRLALQAESPPAVRFEPVIVDGEGLSPEFAAGDWSRLSETIYEGRGS